MESWGYEKYEQEELNRKRDQLNLPEKLFFQSPCEKRTEYLIKNYQNYLTFMYDCTSKESDYQAENNLSVLEKYLEKEITFENLLKDYDKIFND